MIKRASLADVTAIIGMMDRHKFLLFEEGLEPTKAELTNLITNTYTYMSYGDGFFMFSPLTKVMYNVHPLWESGGSKQALSEAVALLKEDIGLSPKVVGFVPEYNDKADRFFQKCEFTVEGVLTGSILRGGTRHNQTVYAKEF